ENDRHGSPRADLISQGLWQRRFGGEAGIIGSAIKLNGETHTIVGVAPPEFRFPDRVEIWTPARLAESQQGRGNNYLMMVGRLKDGVTQAQAGAQMNQIAAALARQYPDNHGKLSILLSPLLDEQVRDIRRALWVMLTAVALVLFVACADVGNLSVAPGAARGEKVAGPSGAGGPPRASLQRP